MKPTLITPIDTINEFLGNGNRIIIRVNTLNQLNSAIKIANETETCDAIICDFMNIDLSTLINIPTKSRVNVFVNCSCDGVIHNLLISVPYLEERKSSENWVFLLPSHTKNLVTTMKILSSYGYRCGLQPPKNCVIDENDFLELATYSYLSPTPHAQIEPFGYMLDEVRKKTRTIDLDDYYFNAPGKYFYISKDGQIALSEEDLLNKKFICNSINELCSIDIEEIYYSHKYDKFYSHFSNEDDCSKCSCMKICTGYFQNYFSNCSSIINDIYEMISICLQ